MAKKETEHVLFQDLPCGRNGKFHSAVLTTYSMDLLHFDSHLRNVLRRKQICSINIFADTDQMNKSLEYVSPLYMQSIGRDYCVTNVSAKGAFHPKINFFAGDNAAMVLIGSGNLTVPGHGKNHEAFTGFMVDEENDTHLPLVVECWNYINRLAKESGEFEKRRIAREIPENCTVLKDVADEVHHQLWKIANNLNAALLYNEKGSSILQQITEIIPLNDVTKVTIASPFFDEDGETLVTLADFCPNAQVNVLIQESCTLPPHKMKSHPRIKFYDFDETKRGKTTIMNYNRLAHVKLFHFVVDDTEYCIVGSANATKPGLGTLSHRGINEEFCVLYVSDQKNFLNVLGLNPKKSCTIQLQNIERKGAATDKKLHHCIELQSAVYQSQSITITYKLKEDLQDIYSLIIDNGIETSSYDFADNNENKLSIKVVLGKHSAMCYVCDSEGNLVSNRIFVNKIEQLDATNPSQASRTLNQFISQIESEGYEGMEITNMLASVMWSIVEESNEQVNTSHASGSSKKRDKGNLPEIDFNATQNNDMFSVLASKIDHSSRLVECIEESIRKKLKSLDDDLKEEEEEGNTEESNERTNDKDSDYIVISSHGYEQFAKSASNVLNEYCKLIAKRSEQMQERGIAIVTKDDLNFFCLSMFAAIEICGLNRMRYDFGDMNSMEKSYHQKKLYESLDRCLDRDCLTALEGFESFCNKFGKDLPDEEDYRNKAHRTMKYVLLYATVFYQYTLNRKLCGDKVNKACKSLIAKFGLPDMDKLQKEIEPLSQRYDSSVTFRQIQRTLKELNA